MTNGITRIAKRAVHSLLAEREPGKPISKAELRQRFKHDCAEVWKEIELYSPEAYLDSIISESVKESLEKPNDADQPPFPEFPQVVGKWAYIKTTDGWIPEADLPPAAFIARAEWMAKRRNGLRKRFKADKKVIDAHVKIASRLQPYKERIDITTAQALELAERAARRKKA